MTGKGNFTQAPSRRLRMMLSAQVFWLLLVCLLGGWWGSLVLRQAARIAELERIAGIGAQLSQENWHRTQRMLFWESSTFFLLLFASTAALFWFYWREHLRSRSMEAFFASLTHELRTPLTSIRLQAETLAESESTQKELIGRLLEDATRLESQVERTLELARVEGGGPVYTQNLQMKPWLERLVRSWKDSYGQRIEFNCELADLTVDADPVALQVVMRNLLENSLRHSQQSLLKIALSTKQSDGGVLLEFHDNGRAFSGDSSKLGMIFQKGKDSQGAGVGLYLVSMLLKRMGGWAKFDATSGFRVSLWLRGGSTHG